MISFIKTIRIRSQKQSLWREAKRALSYAEKTYWEQLSLPEELRDNTLIDESLSVIECAASVLAEGAKRTRTWLFSSSGPLRRVMTVAAVCLLVIALSAGAAYAMGVDVWHMLFLSGSGHSALYTNPMEDHDSKSGDSDDSPFPSIVPMDDFADYTNIAEACDELNITPMLIDMNTVPSLTVNRVYGMAAEASITLFVDYITDGEQMINYMTIRYPDNDTAVLLTAEGFDSIAKIKEIDGITYYVVPGEDETLVMWSSECYAYQITTDLNETEIMAVLEKLN